MASRKIAEIVASIPYGEGKTTYRTVGALLERENNDPNKGPGYVIALDSTFNPAGAPIVNGTVYLSCYGPKEPQ